MNFEADPSFQEYKFEAVNLIKIWQKKKEVPLRVRIQHSIGKGIARSSHKISGASSDKNIGRMLSSGADSTWHFPSCLHFRPTTKDENIKFRGNDLAKQKSNHTKST